MPARDAADDIRDSLALVRRLIEAERSAAESVRSEAYIRDLEAHADKLTALLAKCESNTRK
jgi:hypothetical protein